MFRHPNYYKELRKLRNKLDQAISHSASTEANSRRAPSPESDQVISPLAKPVAGRRAPGPGPKPQAASNKPQAPSSSKKRPQASSPKQQASSDKPQAASSVILEP